MLMFGIRRSTRLVGHRGQEALEDLADEFKQVELGLDVLAQEKILTVREEGLLDALGWHEELRRLLHYWNLRQELLDGEAHDCQHRRAPCVNSCSSMRFRRSGASLSGNNPS